MRTIADNATWVAWSPDGKSLAFSSSREGYWNIYTCRSDGSAAHRITADAGYDSQPAWSPTSDRIAFSSKRDGPQNLYTMKADGTDVHRLTSTDAAPR